jgi:cellulose synthase/poly-beta-1,6-N-acetylglucosamine synthase-like glycosyltransferase
VFPASVHKPALVASHSCTAYRCATIMILLLIVSTFLLTIYISLLLYYRAAWKQIPGFNSKLNKQNTTNISVIIPARNEEENLPVLLRSLSAQNYPEDLFEVLIIDDHSTDNTAALVLSFPAKNIKLVSLKDHIPGEKINSYKKKSIETGIQQSTGTLIVTTDADCFMPGTWLSTIASYYEKYKPAFIAAPVSVNCSKRFIEIFQALDFMTLQGITGASVHKKIHSMCNGANMAYEKAAFYEVGGFKGIDTIASGDDMLLMHKIYRQYPDRVMFLRSREAIVQTAPVKTIKQFFNQRIRWASKADKYDDKRIIAVLLLVYLFNLLLLFLPVFRMFHNIQFSIFNFQFSVFELWLILILLKTVAEIFFLIPVAQFFRKQSLLYLFPLMQPFHIIYTVIAGWLGKFGSYKWKERKVK